MVFEQVEQILSDGELSCWVTLFLLNSGLFMVRLTCRWGMLSVLNACVSMWGGGNFPMEKMRESEDAFLFCAVYASYFLVVVAVMTRIWLTFGKLFDLILWILMMVIRCALRVILVPIFILKRTVIEVFREETESERRVAREKKALKEAKNDRFEKKTWFGKTTGNVKVVKMLEDPEALLQESIRPDSDIRVGHADVHCTFVVYVRVLLDGQVEYRPVGQGVRFRLWAIIPTHVFADHEILYIKLQNGDMLSVATSLMRELMTDISVMRLSEKEWSRVGARTADIEPVPDAPGIPAKCTGIRADDGKATYSVGTVHDGVIFGTVVYNGSTLRGFSGGAYAVGRKVIGVHLKGGRQNQGIALSYIKAKLDRLESGGDTNEDYDWLFRDYKGKNRKLKFEEYGDMDRVIVKARGKYHYVERSTLLENELWCEDIRTGEEVDYRSEETKHKYREDGDIVFRARNRYPKKKRGRRGDEWSEEESDEWSGEEGIPVAPKPKVHVSVPVPADPYNDSGNVLGAPKAGASGLKKEAPAQLAPQGVEEKKKKHLEELLAGFEMDPKSVEEVVKTLAGSEEPEKKTVVQKKKKPVTRAQITEVRNLAKKAGLTAEQFRKMTSGTSSK